MSLNSITLSANLVAKLYQHSLVDGHVSNKPVPPPAPFLGKNNKQILLVVNKPDVPFLPDGELAFLTTVLAACGLDLSAVAIVNWQQGRDRNGPALLEQFRPRQVILFDTDPAEMGLSPALPYAIQTADDVRFAAAPSLSEIEKAKEAKKQLWLVLKQLFGL